MPRFAAVLLVDPRGWLLLQERDEHARIEPERWGLPGGHVDDGERDDDAAYRELAEETGFVLAPPALERWDVLRVHHAAYGTTDPVTVYVGATARTDADVVLGEGRRIVFVEPASALALALTDSAAQVLTRFVGSPEHHRLTTRAAVAADQGPGWTGK